MVRVKNRYMLVNILYPELKVSTSSSKAKIPDIVTFHQPTTAGLQPYALEKAIKLEVENLFGDYGYGAITGSINVKYLSNATSTFIIRVSRDHYRLVWTALSFMTNLPGKDGKNCVFRVVRVSGTIQKAQEEAIRRARELILAAQRDQSGKGDTTLEGIFGKTEETTSTNDVQMVDRSDSEEEAESDE